MLTAVLDHPDAHRPTLLRCRALLTARSAPPRDRPVTEAEAAAQEALAIARGRVTIALPPRRSARSPTMPTFAVRPMRRSLCRTALLAARQVGDATLITHALARRADAFDVAGDQRQARLLLEEAITAVRPTGNRRLLNVMLANSGEASVHLEIWTRPKPRLQEALALAMANRDSICSLASRLCSPPFHRPAHSNQPPPTRSCARRSEAHTAWGRPEYS